jgi:3-methyladenine DNA glycosylase AlkC
MAKFYYYEVVKTNYYKLQITLKDLTNIYLRKKILDKFNDIIKLFGSLDYKYIIENTERDSKFCIIVQSEVITSQPLLDILENLKNYCKE